MMVLVNRRLRTIRLVSPHCYFSTLPPSHLLFGTFFVLSGWIFQAACAQILLNGQVFTNGLAIIDAPAPNTILHTGSSMNLAIDISGDGKLPQIASTTGFDSLTMFLVSTQARVNLTVTASPEFLVQEPGSTVKHLNWPIPTCLAAGPYNLTLYETFHLQGNAFFGITSIPLTILNPNPGVACTSENLVDPQPQPSSPPPGNPWLDDLVSLSNISSEQQSVSAPSIASPWTLIPVPSGMAYASSVTYNPTLIASPTEDSGVITVTIGPPGIQWPLTLAPPGSSETVIIQPAASLPGVITLISIAVPTATITGDAGGSDGGDGTVTVMITPTASVTPVTVVFVSAETLTGTSTAPDGSDKAFTTTSTSFSTTTAVMGPPSSGDVNYAGFLPINAVSVAVHLRASILLALVLLLLDIIVIV